MGYKKYVPFPEVRRQIKMEKLAQITQLSCYRVWSLWCSFYKPLWYFYLYGQVSWTIAILIVQLCVIQIFERSEDEKVKLGRCELSLEIISSVGINTTLLGVFPEVSNPNLIDPSE